MEESVRFGRIAGIPIGMNWSLIIVFWLVSWSLATFLFPRDHPGLDPATYWLAGVATAVLFFGSLLAHELSHALVARRKGVEVEGITLWLFGGVAKLRGEAVTPGAEFQIAIVGPGVSLAVAVLAGAAAAGLNSLGAPAIVVGAAVWLAAINLILAVFNTIPAAPLDGGRVLRALLWARTGDRDRAGITAARAGRAFGFLLIALGLVGFATGAGLSGLWFIFLGWFLLGAARAEAEHHAVRGAVSGIRVGDVMSSDPRTAPSWMPVDAFIRDHVLGDRYSAYPVVDIDGRVVGLVTLTHLRNTPRDGRATTRVSDAMCPLAQVPTSSPDEALADLLVRLTPEARGRALVFEGDRLVGIVSPTDVARVVERAALAGRPLGPVV